MRGSTGLGYEAEARIRTTLRLHCGRESVLKQNSRLIAVREFLCFLLTRKNCDELTSASSTIRESHFGHESSLAGGLLCFED